MKLIATRPVLYMGRTYHQGDVLPAYDKAMVAAWLRAGSAIERTASVLNEVPQSDENYDTNYLEQCTKDELEAIAKTLGIAVPKGATKAQLMELIEKNKKNPKGEGGA